MEKNVVKKQNSDSAMPPSIGSIVEGKVVARDRSSLYIDLGNQGTGIIYGREFYPRRSIGDRGWQRTHPRGRHQSFGNWRRGTR